MGFFGTLAEHKDRLKNFLDKLTNDSHVPIALLVFAVTSAYHFHTGKDLGTNYTNSLYALYGFLGGHALVYQKWPDANHDGIPDNQQTPPPAVTVDVTNTAVAAPAPAADPSKG